MEGLNGLYGQPSNSLKINRLQSGKVIFYRQRSKMQVKVKVNRQQALKYVNSPYFSCSSRYSGRVGSPDPAPYQTLSLFENAILTSTGSYITF